MNFLVVNWYVLFTHVTKIKYTYLLTFYYGIDYLSAMRGDDGDNGDGDGHDEIMIFFVERISKK